MQLTRRGVPVWVVDGKGVEFLGFQDWPNVQIVATSIEEQVAVIHRAWELMEYRYELVTSGRAQESDFEPLVVVLDEYADFRGNLLDWYAGVKSKGGPTRPPVLAKVGSLGRKGRTARIHLIFGTQRPDQEFFGGAGTSDLRDNLRLRISLGRLSPQGAMMMWNSPAIGTAIPVGCRGRATSINDVNQAVEIQTYRTPDPRRTAAGTEEQQLLHRLRPDVASHERLLIVPPDAEAEDDGISQEPTYAAFAQARWVRAADRPDLDPVRHRQEGRHDGRLLAFPLAPLGLVSATPRPGPGAAEPPAEWPAGSDPPPAPTLRLVPELRDDENGYDGFAPPELRPVQQLTVGDRVLVLQPQLV